VPTEAQLKSALLTVADLGSPYTADTSSDNSTEKAGGCEGLANDLNNTSSTPGEVEASASFTAGTTGPFVEQDLWAAPLSSFEPVITKISKDLASCKQLTFTSDGETLTFDLTPFNFAAGATAARLDGTYQGEQLNGYTAVQRVSENVAMLFTYFQIGSGSSQEAFQIYTVAIEKAKRAFPSS
jgi:hypothetical protein